MALIGSENYTGGETLRPRVNDSDAAVLARCNGYKCERGYLAPENVPSDTTTGTALTGTTPEQVPFAFVVDASTTKIIGRDSTTAFREHSAGVWGSAGSTLPIIEGSVPVRMGDQIIYASDGSNPRLMVYEPGSSSTKLRPLSLKSPTDYKAGEYPRVTASANAGVQLFDMIVGTRAWAWAGPDYGTITETTDKVVFDLDSTTAASALVAEKSLATVTVSPTGKTYVVLDYKITASKEEIYPYSVFANDPFLYPSGFLLGLYDDTACTSLIASYRLPRTTLGAVTRVAIALGDQTTTIQGVGVLTDSFFVAPTGTDTVSLTLYSEAFDNNWTHKGNFLFPSVKWKVSPWADDLAGLLGGNAGEVDLGLSGNLLTDGSFELDTGWTFSGGGKRMSDHPHSGGWRCELDENGEVALSGDVTVTAAKEYRIELYNQETSVWVNIEPESAAHGDLADTRWPASGVLPVTDADVYERHELIYTPPATATHFRIRLTATDNAGDPGIDDVAVYAMNVATQGSATILQTFGEDGTIERIPDDPRVQYCYCFAGRDRLGSDKWSLMVSNPSDPSSENPATFADPWRTYALTATLPSGPINTVAAAPTAGGTGYQVGDVLLVKGGTGGKVQVATVSGTAVATVTLLTCGYGYATGTGQETTNETDATGTGCTVNITDVLTPIEEYGSYLTHILIYRRIYSDELVDGIHVKKWGSWTFVQAVAIGASMTWTDAGNDPTVYTLSDRTVPKTLEMTNDYLGSAKYVCYADGRVYALCLDWDNENSVWLRPTAIAVSKYLGHWAFTTTVDANSLMTDGEDLGGLYAQTGAEGRGIVTRNDQKYVFLDNEFFLLRGDNPLTGWQFIRIDSIGAKDARTLVDCRGMLVWHDGHHIYTYTGGGRAENCSRFAIDSTLIDFTHALGACYFDGAYRLFCEYDDTHCLLTFDTESGAWRIRRSDSGLPFAGICTDGANLYGLTTGGNVFNVYGSSTTEATDSGTQSPTRQVWTQYMRLCQPGYDAQVNDTVLIADAPVAVDVSADVYVTGKVDDSDERTISLATTKTRYSDEGINLHGDAAQVRFEYTGTTPPTLYLVSVEADEVSAR